MSRATALARGRMAAEAGMVDACTIRRRTGDTSTVGGIVAPAYADVYAGKCRIQVRSESGSQRTAGEAVVVVQRIELQLPIGAPALLADDEVLMTASAHDEQLVGKGYAVRDVLAKSEATSRRATLIEVTS